MPLGTINENEVLHIDKDKQKPEKNGKKTLVRQESKAKRFSNARCTNFVLWSSATAVGALATLLSAIPFFCSNWVVITEPRPTNYTNDNGEQLEAVFDYNVGYFKMCRSYDFNISATVDERLISLSEAGEKCHFTPMLTGEDLSEFSVASLAVIIRCTLPASCHLIGIILVTGALIAGFIGYQNTSQHTILSTILYILGSIFVSTGVLMFVCVVDDELSPRMKQNAAGEPSKFSVIYGFPFFCASLSFLPVQMCACFHAFLYFRRYPTVAEKLKVIPGLEEKLRHAQLDKELGIPPMDSYRRGSLASYLPFPGSFLSPNRTPPALLTPLLRSAAPTPPPRTPRLPSHVASSTSSPHNFFFMQQF